MSDYLPPEVVSEILVKLPIKSILISRCVCKDWLSIISNPIFITKHISHSSSNTHSITLLRNYSKYYGKEIYNIFHDHNFNIENCTRISFPFHNKAEFYHRIVGYCNGVLCLSDDYFHYSEKIILWNPSIKRALNVPTPEFVFDKMGPYMFALGFSFDYTSNDYKIVRVAYLLHYGKKHHVFPPKVEVFSLNTGVWRPVRNKVECYITKQFWTQGVFDNIVHWGAYKKSSSVNKLGKYCRNVVLRFDLGSEKFDEIDLPGELACLPPININAVTVKGYFGLLCSDYFMMQHRMDLSGKCEIWVMLDYGNVDSWTPIFRVNLDFGLSIMLGFKVDGDVLFSRDNGELVSYNLDQNEVTGTGIFGTKYSFFVDKYVESLVLMDKGDMVRGEEPELDSEDEDNIVEQLGEYQHKCAIFSSIKWEIMSFDA